MINLSKRLRWLKEKQNQLEKLLYVRGLLPRKDLCLPDFLGIGAQKSGTTWLHENLLCHPDLYLPEQKEIHYFDWSFHRSLKSYSDEFIAGFRKIKGEITPGYSILPVDRIQFIQRVMPNLRLIFLMRNPIERAWSQACMNLAVKTGRQVEEIDEAEFYAHFRHKRSVGRGDYLAILDRWLSVFPEDQFYIGFFEDITNRPQGLLIEVFTHIGVSYEVDWDMFPYKKVIRPSLSGGTVSAYEGRSYSLPDKFRIFLEEMYRRDIAQLYERFGSPVSEWLVAGS